MTWICNSNTEQIRKLFDAIFSVKWCNKILTLLYTLAKNHVHIWSFTTRQNTLSRFDAKVRFWCSENSHHRTINSIFMNVPSSSYYHTLYTVHSVHSVHSVYSVLHVVDFSLTNAPVHFFSPTKSVFNCQYILECMQVIGAWHKVRLSASSMF